MNLRYNTSMQCRSYFTPSFRIICPVEPVFGSSVSGATSQELTS